MAKVKKEKVINTHISILLDRSGSMSSIRNDMLGGLNTFIDEQKKEEGIATISLAVFDAQNGNIGIRSVNPLGHFKASSLDYKEIFDFKNIKDVDKVKEEDFVPRGNTPLFDAIGKCVFLTDEKISKLAKKDLPDKVLFVIITDGEENASTEYTKEAIKKLLDEKQEKNKWCFVYLGANQDAFAVGGGMGISSNSVLNYSANARGIADMSMNLTSSTKLYRKSMSNEVLNFDSNEK